MENKQELGVEVIPIIQEKQFRDLYNTGVRRFPVGIDVPCIVSKFTTTPTSITFTLQWGPYLTRRGLHIKPQTETITYSDDDEDLTPYKLLKIIKQINPDAQFLDRTDPEFYPSLGAELLKKQLLANSIEIKVKLRSTATINKTQIIHLKYASKQ